MRRPALRRTRPGRLACLAALTAGAPACRAPARVGGQGAAASCPGVRWSAPVELWSQNHPGAENVPGRPSLAIRGGTVYIVAGLGTPGPSPEARGLRAWRLGEPSAGRPELPVPLGAPAGGNAFAVPLARVDSAGALHLIWEEPGDVMPSATGVQLSPGAVLRPVRRALVWHAVHRGGQWTAAAAVYTAQNLTYSSIFPEGDFAADRDGALHGALPVGLALAYLRPDPDGRSWHATEWRDWGERGRSHGSTPPVLPYGGGYPQLALGPGRRVTLAFVSAAEAADSAGADSVRGRHPSSVFVVRSEDGGRTWADPVVVHLSNGRGASQLQLVSAGGDTLHLVWAQPAAGGFWPAEVVHATSVDGGRRWADPITVPVLPTTDPQMIHTVRATAGPKGDLELAVSATPMPGPDRPAAERIWYARWRAGAWSPGTLLRPGPRRAAGFDFAVDALGRLHLVWEDAAPAEVRDSVLRDHRLWYAVRSPCSGGR